MIGAQTRHRGGRPRLAAQAVVDPLDAVWARDVGELLAAADQPETLTHEPTALATAHTALLYRLRDWPVVTDRTILLHAIHPRVEVRLIRDAWRLPPAEHVDVELVDVGHQREHQVHMLTRKALTTGPNCLAAS